MSGLQRFEQRLESMINGAFARAFRSHVQPVEIAAALQRECDNNAQILSRERRLVPNAFEVELSPADLERLSPYDSALADELTRQVREHAEQQGYSFPGPISIGFERADDLPTGRFRLRGRAQAKVTGTATDTQVRRARAFLDINGGQHPIHPPGVVLGRGTEADIRINDPGVSRRHVEVVVEYRRGAGGEHHEEVHLEAIDLGSTNGVLVDGQKRSRSVLDDGSEIRIGNTTMTVRVVEERVDV